MENPPRSAGMFNYRVGDTPNAALLFIGYCCCCGLSCLIQLHNIRTELKRCFPQIDDSQHWLKVIIGIWGVFVTNAQLEALEKENGIRYSSQIPLPLLIFVPVLWPFTLAEMMRRLNAIAAKRG